MGTHRLGRMMLKDRCIEARTKCNALDFVIEKIFRVSIRKSDEKQSPSEIFCYTDKRTFCGQYHTCLLGTHELPNPQSFTCIHKPYFRLQRQVALKTRH